MATPDRDRKKEREGDRLTHTLSYVLLKAILLVGK